MSYILLNSYEEYITSLTGIYTEYDGIVISEFDVTGQVGENASGEIYFSAITVDSSIGQTCDIPFSIFSITGSAYITPVTSGEIIYSAATVSSAALVGEIGTGDVRFPLAAITGTSVFVPDGDGDIDFADFNVTAYASIPTTELAIRLNTTNFAPSQYSNFSFNSMCVFNGETLCAGASGIFRHLGATDNGTAITAYFQTPSSDLQSHRQKNFRKVYLEGESSGNLSVTAVIDGVEGNTSTVEALGVVGDNQYVFPLDREDRGKNIGILIENKDGADFTISSIYATVVVGNTLPSGNTAIGRCKITGPDFTVAASG